MKNSRHRRASLYPAFKSCSQYLGFMAVFSAIHPALAQDTNQASKATSGTGVIEEVRVTAQRRTERSLDVPIAITAIGSEQLGQGDVQQLSDIMKLTPGLRFDNTGGFAQPTIRGVGTAVVVAGSSSNVGIYADGFYSSNPFVANSELLSVESVQVLKGPQGTLFGRNSTGGAILITTSEPSIEESLELQASYGSYNTQRYQAYATGGTDVFAFDVAGLLRSSDGFIDNIATGSDTDGEYENSAIRLGAMFEPSETLSILLRYAYADTEDNSSVAANAYEKDGRTYASAESFGTPVATQPDQVSNDFLPIFQSEAEAVQLTIKADLDFATLSSYTQYREETATHHEDFDMSEQLIYHFIFNNRDKVFSQEFLLSSSGDGPLQWTTGLFYFNNTSVFDDNRGASPVTGGAFVRNGGSGVEVNSLALFGDMTYELRSDLYLTLGLRYSQDDIEGYLVSSTLVRTEAPKLDDSQLSPRIALRYELGENASTYVSYTEGYKSAILNVGGDSLDGVEVEPEKIKAYEIGYKYNSGQMAFDLAAYYYDYQDLQVASYIGASSVVENAADSSIFGVEGQIRYALTEELEVNVGANYLNTEYDDFARSQVWTQCTDPVACGASTGIFVPSYEDASGNNLARSPELTANIGASYTRTVAEGEFNLTATWYYSSDFYFDSSQAYEQDAYSLLSLRAAWTDPSDTYTVALFGDNLTDEEYRNQVLPQFYGALSTWGAPRTFGVSIALRY